MQEVNRSSDSLQDATADSPFCIVSVNEKKVNIFCVHFYVVLIFTLFVYCFCFPATPCTCHHIAYWKWARYLSTKRISTTPSLGSKEPNRSFVMKMGKLPDCIWSWCAFNSSEYWKRWKTFNLSCKRELVLFQNSFSVETFQRGSWLLRRRPSQQPRRRISTRSVGIERTNSFQSRELHWSQKVRRRRIRDGVQRQGLWWNY